MSEKRPDWLTPTQYNDERFVPPPKKAFKSPLRRKPPRGDHQDIPRNIHQKDPYPLNYDKGPHNNDLDCDDSDLPNEDLYTETFEGPDDYDNQ